MKYLFWTFLAWTMSIANADDWFCKSQTAKRNGNVLSVCGIGLGMMSEEAARGQAMRMAKLTFQDICYMDDDCKNRLHISAEPKRTECVQTSQYLITCYQLLEFTIN